ncbi:FtsX-like permease family protein [Sphingosinicella terrae]|uniref:FtsX-like permease family protein n=1 Tax=Sphingosinicella terrae TaxID=2172047 RepID=UPI000E0D29A4|nr:FtsX-like permease family protein [Sphingosinicella terrae]
MRLPRHWLVAWRRNLAANRLLSAIAIAGLAIGLAGAILMTLVARVPLTYNHQIPDHERTYLAVSVMSGGDTAPDYQEASPGRAAALIEAMIAGVEAAARLMEDEAELRLGGTAHMETIYWADPDAFDLLRLPVLHGDLDAALRRSDGLVMTEGNARRHFGRADALGETVDVAGHPMVLRAVIADLPPGGTDLSAGIFASGTAAHSGLAQLEADGPDQFSISVRTYLRLRPGASEQEARDAIQPAIAGLLPPPLRPAYRLEPVRIDRFALHEGFHPGARERLVIGSLVAALVLLIATANFVNLSVALAGRRRREIGVRKANGAGRGHIAAQFLAEAVLTILVATVLALAMSEWLLPAVNGFLETQARLDYSADPGLLLKLVAGAVLLGIAAGAYPAFLLSSLPPTATLRDAPLPGGSLVRSVLVTAQFAILIGLIIATAVVHQQRQYAMREALRMDIDQVLTVAARCPAAFVAETAKLPGVRAVSCSGKSLLTGEMFAFIDWNGGRVTTQMVSALPSIFALYGVRPVAGTLATLPKDGEEAVSRVVINEAAARAFGFASPAAAIGETLPALADASTDDSRTQVVAVVPDFTFQSIEKPIEPILYLPRPPGTLEEGLVSIRLAGGDVPETLAHLDRLWRATGNEGPMERAFVSEHVERLYRNLERNAQLFAIFSSLAIFLAGLGLVGLSLSAAQRRTKEIGIRKALGASTGRILMLLLWQLSRPVLLANVIAWPVAWWLMRHWLNGFAERIPLQPWLFPAAGLIALAVALLSVGMLAYLVARQRPVHALRYE